MMKYALNIGEDGRILSATYEDYVFGDMQLVNQLPQGNVSDYRYVDGEYIYDPVYITDVEEIPTQLDRIEAQVTYTAMMTDTLLEV